MAGFGACRLRQGFFCPQIYVSVRWRQLDEAFNNLHAGHIVGGGQLAYLQAECDSLHANCRPFGCGWSTGVYSRSQAGCPGWSAITERQQLRLETVRHIRELGAGAQYLLEASLVRSPVLAQIALGGASSPCRGS